MHIDDYELGRIQIDGVWYSKDVILLQDEVRCPWWRSAGGHRFEPADLGELLEGVSEVVVLGTGFFGRVRVSRGTLAAFEDAGSEVIVEKTAQAVKDFNRLAAEGREVAAALHLTC